MLRVLTIFHHSILENWEKIVKTGLFCYNK